MGKYFGTDGIRGIANKELTCELALAVGKAVTRVLIDKKDGSSKILVGKDTRISGDMIESALLAGICSEGVNGVSLGVVPTPAVAYLVRKYKADVGIMISASHNPYEFNGIKVFDKNGFKLPDKVEEEIEAIIQKELECKSAIKHDDEKVGMIFNDSENAINDYVEYVSNTISEPINKNIKIIVDCANGSASSTAAKLFGKLGIKADFINNNPNGLNINEECGSTSIEKLYDYVIDGKYDLGIAFDGDADRCLAVDEKGNIIDGDAIVAICAKSLKGKGKLKNNTLVSTIMANAGLAKFCKENAINFEETKVGDRYVLQKMLEKGYCIGAEQSGHVIFLEHSTTGDGQLTAVQFLSVLSSFGLKASELNNFVKKYPQVSSTVNITAEQKGKLEKNKVISDSIRELREKIGENGKVVVRESGTEPKIRVMIEYNDEKELEEMLKSTVRLIKENIK